MTISITRALAQIKSLDARIAETTSSAFVTYQTNGKTSGGSKVAEVETVLKANLQSVKDMISQRQALKAAVVASNAVTLVQIAGGTMTVAQAIERKTSIQQERSLLQQLKVQFLRASKEVENGNQQMQVRLDKLIETAVGKDRKVDQAEIAAIVDPFKAANEVKLVDPVGIQQVIQELENSINAFMTEVDYALSEINAVAHIHV